MTDDDLEALLRETPDGLADDGFTERVMRRVRATQASHGAPLDAQAALRQLRTREARARRAARWRWIGAAVGIVAALAPIAAGLPVVALQVPQLCALVVAVGAAAWGLAAPTLREGA
jgi:anti-sigma-K factor RskA